MAAIFKSLSTPQVDRDHIIISAPLTQSNLRLFLSSVQKYTTTLLPGVPRHCTPSLTMSHRTSHVLLTLLPIWAALFFHTTSSSPLLLAQRQDDDGCVTQDSANPHAEEYPDFVSGNLNGTTLIVPIPLSIARQVIPSQYGILEDAYRSLLPSSFPQDAYPMMAVGVHDHDIQFPAYGAHPSDFSVS